MITNKADSAVSEALSRCREEIVASGPFLDAMEAHPEPFAYAADGRDFEFSAGKPVEGRPNRAVVKIFAVPDGQMKGKAAVFFYKRSQVPFSRDRFSYGVCMLPATGASAGDMKEWLDYASGGFHPEALPPKLRRAFTFTVPD